MIMLNTVKTPDPIMNQLFRDLKNMHVDEKDAQAVDLQFQHIFDGLQKHEKCNKQTHAHYIGFLRNVVANNAKIQRQLLTLAGKHSEQESFATAAEKKFWLPTFMDQIYTKTVSELVVMAKQRFMDDFFPNLNMVHVNADYHHIVDHHLKSADLNVSTNALEFFSRCIHFYDSQIECKSVQRINEASSKGNKKKIQAPVKDGKQNALHIEDGDDWKLRQRYKQTQLDSIHAHLVHGMESRRRNEESFNKSTPVTPANKMKSMKSLYQMKPVYSKKHSIWPAHGKFTVDAFEDHEMEEDDEIHEEFANKLFSDAAGYGFGVTHDYPSLKAEYTCIYQELIKGFGLDVPIFRDKLIKAINAHSTLRCSYYDSRYNLLKGQPIGLRHLFSVILYTDLSEFCKQFRRCFRKLHDKEKTKEVYQRLSRAYWIGRSLFEAIEFHGTSMKPTEAVYHGLNVVLQFEHLTGQFYQPLSTTPQFVVANQFSGGTGLILEFKGVGKYLEVSWLSSFQKEEEKLFYGKCTILTISDITEAKTGTTHAWELKMLRTFEELMSHQKDRVIDWSGKDDVITTLVILIKHQQNLDWIWDAVNAWLNSELQQSKVTFKSHILQFVAKTVSKYYDDEIDEFECQQERIKVNPYCRELFHYYCTHPKRKTVTISKWASIPADLKKALFTYKNNKEGFSVIPLLTLFPYLNRITFIEDSANMVNQYQQCTTAVAEYMKIIAKSSTDIRFLKKISIVGNDHAQDDSKSDWQDILSQHSLPRPWKDEYSQSENCVTLINYNKNKAEFIKKLHVANPLQQVEPDEHANSNAAYMHALILQLDTRSFVQHVFGDFWLNTIRLPHYLDRFVAVGANDIRMVPDFDVTFLKETIEVSNNLEGKVMVKFIGAFNQEVAQFKAWVKRQNIMRPYANRMESKGLITWRILVDYCESIQVLQEALQMKNKAHAHFLFTQMQRYENGELVL